MSLKASISRGGKAAISALALGIAVVVAPATAQAHPHDLLAQCQLPDGKWVMCDQTTHDTLTGKHVDKPSAGRPGTKKSLTAPRS